MRIEYDAESGEYLFQHADICNEKNPDWTFFTAKETVQWFMEHQEDLPKSCAECVFCRYLENYKHYTCNAINPFPYGNSWYPLHEWINIKEVREKMISPHCPIIAGGAK